MPAPTQQEIKNAWLDLRQSEIAPLGINLDMVAALLLLQIQNGSSGGGGGSGGIASSVSIQDNVTNSRKLIVNSDGSINVLDNLGIPTYDYASANPSFDNTSGTTTITYKRGGISGVVVGTLTLTYDASGNLLSVLKG